MIIRDVYCQPCSTEPFVFTTAYSSKISAEETAINIKLMGNTARTQVSFKDNKGRFVSYRTLDPQIVDAMDSLIPFPTGD